MALALLSFGLYAAADLVSAARRTSLMTRNSIQANGLAQLKLEELRCAGASVCASASQSGLLAGNVFEQNPRYSWSAQVSPCPSAAGSMEVVVSVISATENTSNSLPLAKTHGLIFCSAAATKGATQ